MIFNEWKPQVHNTKGNATHIKVKETRTRYFLHHFLWNCAEVHPIALYVGCVFFFHLSLTKSCLYYFPSTKLTEKSMQNE